MHLRSELQTIVDALLAAHATELTLDALGEAIGTRAVSTDEIDAMMRALEGAGRTIVTRQGGDGEQRLKRVLDAARALRAELGRAPTVPEIADKASLDASAVRHALSLARIMQR